MSVSKICFSPLYMCFDVFPNYFCMDTFQKNISEYFPYLEKGFLCCYVRILNLINVQMTISIEVV